MPTIQFTGGVNDAHRVETWGMELWHSHRADQFFSPFTGTSSNSVIQEKMDFTKNAGYKMTESLIMPFESAGVVGDEQMEDNEEAPDFHSMTWTISQIRNAGRVAGQETEQSVKFNLPDEIRLGLNDWMKETRDEHIFDAVSGSCTKIFYVNSRTGTSTVQSTDLMTLDDWFKAKQYATGTADPKIPPLKIVRKGMQTVYRYICVMHPHVSYDMQINDSDYQTIATTAGERGGKNSLFTGSLIEYKGLALYEHDNCTIATGWGSGADVYGAESYLLGRQAAIVGIGGYRMQSGKNGYLRWVEKKFDYDNQFGICVGIIKGEAKSTFNSKDYAVVAYRSARTNI